MLIYRVSKCSIQFSRTFLLRKVLVGSNCAYFQLFVIVLLGFKVFFVPTLEHLAFMLGVALVMREYVLCTLGAASYVFKLKINF